MAVGGAKLINWSLSLGTYYGCPLTGWPVGMACQHWSLLLPPGPHILLKLTEHGDSTTQGREPVSDVYIAQHCYSVVLGSGSSIGMVASSTR